MAGFNQRHWGRYAAAICIAVAMAVPVLFLLINAFYVDGDVWRRLLVHRVPLLTLNTFRLVTVVLIGSVIVGTLLAFLVERTDLPFKKILRPLLISPLIFPCYIIALCYINFFGIHGLGEKLFASMGFDVTWPSIYGFAGAAGILTIGAYPYVYTIVGGAMKRMDPSFSEAARCLGAGKFRRMWTVTLPLLFPAISAGAALATLYVLSDFGVVSLLRYSTFVNTIYEQISGRFDFSTATALSSILLIFTVGIFMLQEMLLERRQFSTTRAKKYQPDVYVLGPWTIPALGFVVFFVVAGLLIPLGILLYWFLQSKSPHPNIAIWAGSFEDVFRAGWHSLILSMSTATLAVIISLPIAYWLVRNPESRTGKVVGWLSQSGVALPGVLIALGISLIFAKISSHLNYSVFALILAFLVHYFSQSLQMTRAGLLLVSSRYEEGARLLGKSSFDIFWNITRPLLKPALISAWILVFLSSMRELPASLLLRPAGFDPLTVKIWIAASEGFYEQAALPSLMLAAMSLPLIVVIHRSKFVQAAE